MTAPVKRTDPSITQVAEYFSCGSETIYKLIRSGRLKAYRLGGDGAYRIPWAEVERAKSEWMYKPDLDKAL